MSSPIFYIKNGSLNFADKVIFDDIEIHLYRSDKICLIGRNGSGKSSLMKIIAGQYQLSDGQKYQDPTISIAYLTQDTTEDLNISAYDFVLNALENDSLKYKADIIFEALKIDGNKVLSDLSGGQLRRVYLARALTLEPDILLLDEPTNHLDIIAIEWLEDYIKSYKGSVICISHDRAFLSNVTNKIWWVDRTVIRKSNNGFKYFEEWQESVLTQEEATLTKLQKKLDEENIWLGQGVTARRKRNQKRLADLRSLRAYMRSQVIHHQQALQKTEYAITNESKKMQFIIEAENITFDFNGTNIIKNFSIRVKKGEKIGLIGPNGSGKTTLIKLLLKELQPITGKVRHGSNLSITYFDQNRVDLNPELSIKATICPSGGDYIFLPNGNSMHVASYLRNFMFHPKIIDSKVATLSGGEANRLLLAKTLINPGDFMLLDEPTNDLDMDMLEILIEILSDYNGTIIIVSHDRDFLEKLVSRTLIFTESKELIDIAGGYEDYIKYYRANTTQLNENTNQKHRNKINKILKVDEVKKSNNKPTYRDVRLLKEIPKQIEELENLSQKIEYTLSDNALYLSNPQKFDLLANKLNDTKNEIERLTNLWIKLDENL